MKRLLLIGVLLVMFLSLTGFSGPVRGPQTYTVLVGSENPRQGVSIMAFFPAYLRVHVGDTVVWKANSHEIHNVAFLDGRDMPEVIIPAPAGQISPLMFNPDVALPIGAQDGKYDGQGFVNSGLMSVDPGQIKTFSLTFTAEGKFEYLCTVHGMMMSGVIEVVPDSVPTLAPSQVRLMGKFEMFRAWAGVPAVMREANQLVQEPVKNPDGTRTWTVPVGYSSGQIDVMRFFPKNLRVAPGDTVVWKLSDQNVAPHTITFLGKGEDPEIVVPVPQPGGPPLLLLNPELLFPSQNVLNGDSLNKTDYFNSGLLVPGTPNTSFTLKIGDIRGRVDYMCALHDTSGMVGSLFVGSPAEHDD